MYEGHRGRLPLGGRGLRKEKREWIMMVRKREHAELCPALRLVGSYDRRKKIPHQTTYF